MRREERDTVLRVTTKFARILWRFLNQWLCDLSLIGQVVYLCSAARRWAARAYLYMPRAYLLSSSLFIDVSDSWNIKQPGVRWRIIRRHALACFWKWQQRRKLPVAFPAVSENWLVCSSVSHWARTAISISFPVNDKSTRCNVTFFHVCSHDYIHDYIQYIYKLSRKEGEMIITRDRKRWRARWSVSFAGTRITNSLCTHV